jgi:hypothetical protein
MIMKPILLIGFLLLLLAFGSYCVFFPKSVQAIAVKAISIGVTSKSSALKSYVGSNDYIFSVRAIGIIAYMIGVLLVVALYRGEIR